MKRTFVPWKEGANAMTTSEVEDFGFGDNTGLYSHIRSPGPATNGATFHDDEEQGFVSTGLGDAPLEMFKIERAQLNLNITIQQLVVSNNILIMASTEAKVYKIDLANQEQIVGISLLSFVSLLFICGYDG